MLRAEVYRTIEDFDERTFNELGDDAFFTYQWFKTLETCRAFKIIPRYVAVHDGGEIVSVAPCFIEYDSQYPTMEESSPWMRRFRNVPKLLGCSFHPPLTCDSPCSFHSRILIMKKQESKRILSLISAKIDEICRKERILFSSFRFVSEQDKLLMTNLTNLGYVKGTSVPSAYMNVKWPTFEDYVRHFKRKTGKNIRREINENEKSGITIKQEENLHKLPPILSDLHSKLLLKHTRRMAVLASPFFEELDRCAKNKMRLFTATRGESIVGFSLCLEHSGVLDVYVAGFDYRLLRRNDFTYFNLVYYEPIRTAIEHRLRKIHFRPGSIQTKLHRGCQIENLYAFTKGHAPFLKPILKGYVRLRYGGK